jgi:glycosyltransferase involved in cell wall biosynthesis
MLSSLAVDLPNGDAPPATNVAVSVVVPLKNEVESLVQLIEQIAGALVGYRYEIIAVDDGSQDGTTELLKQLAGQRQDLRAVILRRNYGQTAAMAAGLAMPSFR